MTIKKIVLKVNINCQKCKTQVLKAATKLTGIDQVTVDGEKGILTVIGDVDPVRIVCKLRKIRMMVVEIISVGSPEADKPKPKPESEPKPKPLPRCCIECQRVPISIAIYEEAQQCYIL